MDKGPLIRGLCQECFRQRYRLLQVPSELQLTICRKCNAYSADGRWFPAVSGSLESAIRAVVLSNVRAVKLTPSGIQLLATEKAKGLELSMKTEISQREAIVDIFARGKVHELQVEPKEERIRVMIKLKWTTCDVCKLKGAGHHEAILQVRGKGKLSAEVLRDIRKKLERCAIEAGRKNRAAFIAKIEDVRGGLDLYINPISLARRMADLLKAEFGAEVSETRKLIGRTPNGQRKFKVSLLARL